MDVLHSIREHYILTSVILGWFLLWVFCYATRGVCRSKTLLHGKTVLITGSSSGIGRETARELARRGARVLMACIDLPQAHAVRENIVRETNNEKVVVMFIDLSNMDSVRRFAEEVVRTERRLDVLIHNAGVIFPPSPVTQEGLNTSMATNYFGPFLLTHLLVDLLKRTEKSRIVIVSSTVYKYGESDPETLNITERDTSWNTYDFLKFYKSSKFAINIFTKELSRRLEPFGVTCNFLHPGYVYSYIFFKRFLSEKFSPLFTFILPFVKTAEQGAQTSIHLAVSDDVDGVSGKYFTDCKETRTIEAINDATLANRYWEATERIVKMLPTEPQI